MDKLFWVYVISMALWAVAIGALAFGFWVIGLLG